MHKRIKILYLITDLNVGGAEMVLWRILGGLNRQDFEPIVVSIITPGLIGKEIEKLGIKIFNLKAKQKLSLFPFFRLIRIIIKEQPKILNSFLFHADISGRIAGRICGVPIIISSIRSENFSKVREKILGITKKLCNVVIAVSETCAKKAIKNKIVLSHQIRVIANGVDAEKFKNKNESIRQKIRQEINIDPGAKLMISVGSLREAKGYSYLIKAINILREEHSNVFFVILGEGEKRGELEKEIKDYKLEKNIFLLGQKNNIADYLAASDYFVLPSLWEGMPNTLLEAMASGMVCIATAVSGVTEIIDDGENGFLVTPGDEKALAQKIENVLSLPRRRKLKIEEAAIQKIMKKFSIDKMVNQYQELYREQIKKLEGKR